MNRFVTRFLSLAVELADSQGRFDYCLLGMYYAPELTAEAVRPCLQEVDVQTLFIEPGSPWENGYVESFTGKMRNELLNRELFYALQEGTGWLRDGGRSIMDCGRTALWVTDLRRWKPQNRCRWSRSA